MMVMRDQDLDRLLARAAAAAPRPSPALLDRVLADAVAEQDRRAALSQPARPEPRPIFGWLVEAFGGTPGLAGVFTAAIAGVAIGYLEPGMFDLLTGGDAEIVDLFSEVDYLTTEG